MGRLRVEVETDSTAALARILAHEPFHLIVSDVVMPIFTGLDLVARVRAARPELVERMISITGGVLDHGQLAALEAIGVPVLDEPIARDALRDASRPVSRCWPRTRHATPAPDRHARRGVCQRGFVTASTRAEAVAETSA